MLTEPQLNLIELYKEIKQLIDNMYREYGKNWFTTDIERAIIEVEQGKFSDKELEQEHKNIKALRDFLLKRLIISDNSHYRFHIMKTLGVVRTLVIIDTAITNIRSVDIKIPSTINRLQISSKLIRNCNNTKINLYLKDLRQLHQDYILLEEVVEAGTLKIFENGVQLKPVEIQEKLKGETI